MRPCDDHQRFPPVPARPELIWDGRLPPETSLPADLRGNVPPVEVHCLPEGLGLRGCTQVIATAYSSRVAVTYELDVNALGDQTRAQVYQFLASPDTAAEAPLTLLKKLFEVTGPDGWTGSQVSGANSISPGAYADYPRLQEPLTTHCEPHTPSLSEYLQHPERLGQTFATERDIDGRASRLEAIIEPHKRLALFSLLVSKPDGSGQWQHQDSFAVSGTLPNSASPEAIAEELEQIVGDAFNRFEKQGYVGFQPSQLAPLESCTIQLDSSSYTLTSGASVHVDVLPQRVVLAISTGNLDQATLENNAETSCRWTFSTPSSQSKERIYKAVSKANLLLTQPYKPAAARDAIKSVLTMRADSEEITVAPPDKILPAALVKHLSENPLLPEMRTGVKIQSAEVLHVADFTDMLRGAHRLHIILPKEVAPRSHRQLFHRMGVEVQSDGSIHLFLRNRMHHFIKAQFSVKTVQPTAVDVDKKPEQHLLSIVTAALARQMKDGKPSSQGRAKLLSVLHDFRKRDRENNKIEDLGRAKLPGSTDVAGHRLVDLAAPLIKHFNTLGGHAYPRMYSYSRVTSVGAGEAFVIIGYPYHPCELTLQMMDDSVCEIAITPRFKDRRDRVFLNHSQARRFSCALPLNEEKAGQDSREILKRVITEFWKFTTSEWWQTRNNSDSWTDHYHSSSLKELIEAENSAFTRQ